MDKTLNSPSVRLTVSFEIREDGGLRVFSDDVPELVLSHRDREAVLADIEPALITILSAKLGYPVTVRPLRNLRDVLDEAVEESDSAASVIPAHLCDRSYVAHHA